eukprot:5305201-Alexandrium_andersonii.AAC.1
MPPCTRVDANAAPTPGAHAAAAAAAISDLVAPSSRQDPWGPRGPPGALEALAFLAEGLGRAGLACGRGGPAVHAAEGLAIFAGLACGWKAFQPQGRLAKLA